MDGKVNGMEMEMEREDLERYTICELEKHAWRSGGYLLIVRGQGYGVNSLIPCVWGLEAPAPRFGLTQHAKLVHMRFS